MATITKSEFEQLCEEIRKDREKIITHNPIGTREETLLWMLLSVLISYLSIEANEAPCFTGVPDSTTYKNAIDFVLAVRKASDFETGPIIERMLGK